LKLEFVVRFVSLVLPLVAIGCGLPEGNLVVYTADSPELANASVNEAGVWESVPWKGQNAPWIEFGPRLTVELEHTLGYEPRVVLVYLAFDPEGTDPALAAGDLARVVEVTDTTVSVKNDTNATYYIRVVAY
jgi:hypothetical protein